MGQNKTAEKSSFKINLETEVTDFDGTPIKDNGEPVKIREMLLFMLRNAPNDSAKGAYAYFNIGSKIAASNGSVELGVKDMEHLRNVVKENKNQKGEKLILTIPWVTAMNSVGLSEGDV